MYAPALLLLGKMVRDCNWAGRKKGSGKIAREVQLFVLAILHGIQQSKDRQSDPYINSIVPSLLTFEPLQDNIAAAAFSEEFCEAMLARFAALWADHPSVKTVPEVCDLFVTLPEVVTPLKDLGASIPPALQDAITRAVPALLMSIIRNTENFHVLNPKANWTAPTSVLTVHCKWPAKR